MLVLWRTEDFPKLRVIHFDGILEISMATAIVLRTVIAVKMTPFTHVI